MLEEKSLGPDVALKQMATSPPVTPQLSPRGKQEARSESSAHTLTWDKPQTHRDSFDKEKKINPEAIFAE